MPPGCARLATRPVPTGSPAEAKTIGMTDVACFAATIVEVHKSSTLSPKQPPVHRTKIRLLMSVQGRVSRVSPVQTAIRNCTRDEGRSFEAGSQVPASNRCKLLSSKAME